jgi:uncharacterized protein (TIGR02246 family)
MFIDAWNRHDMAAFASLFADDAEFVNVVGMWWRNRAQIEAAHRYSHETFFRASTLSGKVEALRYLRPDVAQMHVFWELRGQVEPDGRVGRPRRGILLLIAVNKDGAWLIEAAQNTDIVPEVLTRPAG